jgi:hypothetical protein
MSVLIDALTTYQAGIEGTRGTLVAATSKLAVERVDFDESGIVYRPKLAKGLMLRNRGNETIVMRGTTWTIPDSPLIYDQFQLFLAMAVDGGVTAVGASTPWTWTFTRGLTADPVLDSTTLERRISDGTNHVDHEYGYALCQELTVRYAQNEPVRFSASGFARRQQSSTLTSALVLPSVEIPPTALGKVFIDTSWGGLGGTQITSQVIGAELTFRSGAMPMMTVDGRTDLDFTLAVINPEDVSLSLRLTCLVDHSRYATEKAAAVAQSLRAVRLELEGSASRNIFLDGLYKYSKPDVHAIGQQDGQDIVVLELEEATDGTNLFSVVLVNTTDNLDGSAP